MAKTERIQRACTVRNLYAAKFSEFTFDGDWLKLLGNPERSGSWCIHGGSGEGKTTFAMQLAAYLSTHERVLFNSVEMGMSKATRLTMQRAGITPEHNILIVNEDFEQLCARLEAASSQKIIITDSVDYFNMDKEGFRLLEKQFSNRLFIWLCHGFGKDPELKLSVHIKRKSHVKIKIEGYKALATSRFENSGEKVIWDEGAEKYWSQEAFKI